jgi:transcriptional regulator with XRE-family HTH domain
MTDFIENKDIELPDEVPDFGTLLRTLRANHGYSVQRLSKMVGLPAKTISDVELSKRDLPPENQLRLWLNKLGCGRNTHKIIVMSRQYRVKHWLTLNRKESCNPDMLRLIDAYRNDKLSDYDRALLKLIAR